VKVIGHQTKAVNLPACLLAGLLQRANETAAIGILDEDGFLAVAAVHHVVNRARVLNPEFARHGSVRISTSTELLQ
jgi:hypothetical protein